MNIGLGMALPGMIFEIITNVQTEETGLVHIIGMADNGILMVNIKDKNNGYIVPELVTPHVWNYVVVRPIYQ